MLVYFVNHSVAPKNLGGAERSMIKLVEDWYASDPDFEAFFLTKAPRGQFIKAIEERGWNYQAYRYRGWTVPKEDAPLSEITYFAREDYASTLKIIELMEERRPDLVVTNTVVAPWGAFAAKALGIPHTWFVREYGDLDHGLAFQIGREKTFADIGLLSEAVFTNSLALKKHIGNYLDESAVTVVYPTVDRDELAARSVEAPAVVPFPRTEEGTLRATVVGRVSESKGQWRVIDALGVLHQRGIAIDVCFVGSWEIPDYDVQLMAKARELGVGDHVTIVGEQPNPFPFIGAADICITPSSFEAFGRTTLEYMLMGKAVVASTRGGSAELVDEGVSGFRFEPDDSLSLANALERYALDRSLVAEHGENGKARAESFASDEFSNQAAIRRLQSLQGAEAYQLPHIARYWFALPGHFSEMQKVSPSMTLSFIRTRLRGRIVNLAKRPVAAVRRVVGK